MIYVSYEKRFLMQRYSLFCPHSKKLPDFFSVLLRQTRNFRTKKHQTFKNCLFFSQEEGYFCSQKDTKGGGSSQGEAAEPSAAVGRKLSLAHSEWSRAYARVG